LIAVLTDTSVLLKWFHLEGEDEVPAARAMLRAHRAEQVDVKILDLSMYELGNILLRKLGWTARDVADQLDDVQILCGSPLALVDVWRREAADLAEQHGLSFYDAAFAAAARGLGVALVSADRQLIAAGLAESVTRWAERMRLSG